VQSSHFAKVELDRIVSGKRGWVTQASIECTFWGDRPFFCWGDSAKRDSYASRPCVQSSPFKMVEMDKIVSGKTGWVTRASTEYAFWGARHQSEL